MAVTLDDHFLCPCGQILPGVEAAALHAAAEHPDATELTMLNLDTAPLPPLAQPY